MIKNPEQKISSDIKDQLSDYKFVNCTLERHAKAIVDILNEAIINSTALYDYKPRSLESMVWWFISKEKNNFPVIGIEDSQGELVAFGTYGNFRAWPAYKYSVEHSVYVKKEARKRGLGRAILQKLVQTAQENDIHSLIGGIDASNECSIKLHESLGFKHAGTLHQVGYKFGRWLDLAFYEFILPTPSHPKEG
ncbi:GNAT family N-acetyltransferase [Aristophania vespae]|uniref:GNAT family N-acetyltransferase n=1 Tax=Aristophania vespae TaxID=2697033 RepID=UPI0023518ACA|nr:GNAT family N-acetyltransferase [Aristophania vespae]UMM63588.1 L-methionine sulfoximine/L-methionine sulfone acetyltransferase [Aristophania vespae]